MSISTVEANQDHIKTLPDVPLLEVHNLKKYYPIKKGLFPGQSGM